MHDLPQCLRIGYPGRLSYKECALYLFYSFCILEIEVRFFEFSSGKRLDFLPDYGISYLSEPEKRLCSIRTSVQSLFAVFQTVFHLFFLVQCSFSLICSLRFPTLFLRFKTNGESRYRIGGKQSEQEMKINVKVETQREKGENKPDNNENLENDNKVGHQVGFVRNLSIRNRT